MKIKQIISMVSISLSVLLSGCASTGYICPVNNQVGACSSQQTAYKAALHTDGKGLSVFDRTGDK